MKSSQQRLKHSWRWNNTRPSLSGNSFGFTCWWNNGSGDAIENSAPGMFHGKGLLLSRFSGPLGRDVWAPSMDRLCPSVLRWGSSLVCLHAYNPQKNKPEIWPTKMFFLDFHFGFVSMNCGRTPTFSCWRCQKRIRWPLFLLRVLVFRPEEALKLALSWNWNCSDKTRVF